MSGRDASGNGKADYPHGILPPNIADEPNGIEISDHSTLSLSVHTATAARGENFVVAEGPPAEWGALIGGELSPIANSLSAWRYQNFGVTLGACNGRTIAKRGMDGMQASYIIGLGGSANPLS